MIKSFFCEKTQSYSYESSFVIIFMFLIHHLTLFVFFQIIIYHNFVIYESTFHLIPTSPNSHVIEKPFYLKPTRPKNNGWKI